MPQVNSLSFAIVTTCAAEKNWLLSIGRLLDDYINHGDLEWPEEYEINIDVEERACLMLLNNTGITIEDAKFTDGPEVFIHGDEVCIESVIKICKMFISRFRPSNAVWFTWSSANDRPRVNEFSGGFCVVTQDKVIKNDCMDMVYDILNKDSLAAINYM